MSTIKDKNGNYLTEAEEIKKRWQEYTEELYKKVLMTQITNGVITHLEPNILECQVKWALGSIITNEASGYAGIPTELLQILKDDALKVLHSLCQKIWKNSAVATGLEKISFHSNSKERQCQRMFRLHSFHLLARLCPKSFKIGFNTAWTKNFQMYKLDLEKAEEPEINCHNILDHRKSSGIQKKTHLRH